MQSPDYRPSAPQQERTKDELSFAQCQSMDEIFDVLRLMEERRKRLRGDSGELYTSAELMRIVSAVENTIHQTQSRESAVSMPYIEKVLNDYRVPENGGLRRGLLSALTAEYARSNKMPPIVHQHGEEISRSPHAEVRTANESPTEPFTARWLEQLPPQDTMRMLLARIQQDLGINVDDIRRGCTLRNTDTGEMVTTWVGRAPNKQMIYAFNGGRTPTSFSEPIMYLNDILLHHRRADQKSTTRTNAA